MNLDQLQQLFLLVLEYAEEDRQSFLVKATGGDEQLIRKVMALVDADRLAEKENFLNPIKDEPEALDGWVGRKVGPYRVHELIGRGGMGRVYRAQREDEYRKEVALKVLPVGSDSEEMLRRFHEERQVLASLEHRHITRLLDGGRTEDGQPYFAMEFIRGQRLDNHCRDKELDLRGRVALVLQACEAVQHAHQHGIIHRDLKPANILVTPEGELRVLDFGLARRLSRDQAEEFTQSGILIGTPSYMAPEQTDSDRVAELSTATDVYALGAVLYQLLTGQLPFPGENALYVIRKVREEDPVPPRRLSKSVPRDLETICLKCLEKSPPRRYATVDALAQDLKHWQRGEPITARPVGNIEASYKWVRRHPQFTALMVGLILVIAGSLGLLWRHERGLREEQVRGAVESLANVEVDQVPKIMAELEPFGQSAAPMLRKRLEQSLEGSKEAFHLALALLPHDSAQAGLLISRVPTATPEEILVMQTALRTHADLVGPKLWQLQDDENTPSAGRFRIRCLLAGLTPTDSRWSGIREKVVADLLRENLIRLPAWMRTLEPVRKRLVDPLRERLLSAKSNEEEGLAAAMVLGSFLSQQSQSVAELVLECTPQQISYLAPSFRSAAARQELQKLADAEPSNAGGPFVEGEDREQLYNSRLKRRARLLLALLLAGEKDQTREALKLSFHPQLRSYLVSWMAPARIEPTFLLAWLEEENDPVVAQALILGLGQYSKTILDPEALNRGKKLLGAALLKHPDPGVHSACEWALVRWREEDFLGDLRKQLPRGHDKNRPWYVNNQGTTFAVVNGPVEFFMGSQEFEWMRAPDLELLHRCRISRTFAIATTEVKMADFLQFLKESRQHLPAKRPIRLTWASQSPDCPANEVTWLEAAMFCNWLSEREGIPLEEWCYPSWEELKSGPRLHPDTLYRKGYRLPTESEWECACRAGVLSAWNFGSDWATLSHYAWHQQNSFYRTKSVGLLMPNFLGLFDMHGNVQEWCHSRLHFYQYFASYGPSRDDAGDGPELGQVHRMVRGGDFQSDTFGTRSARRAREPVEYFAPTIGFRLARTVTAPAVDAVVRSEWPGGCEAVFVGPRGVGHLTNMKGEATSNKFGATKIQIPGGVRIYFRDKEPVPFSFFFRRAEGAKSKLEGYKLTMQYDPVLINWDGKIFLWPEPEPPTKDSWEKAMSGEPFARFQGESRNFFSGQPRPPLPESGTFLLHADAQVNWPPGTYEFILTGQSGTRLLVDGKKTLESGWHDWHCVPITRVFLPAGKHTLRLEGFGQADQRLPIRFSVRRVTDVAK